MSFLGRQFSSLLLLFIFVLFISCHNSNRELSVNEVMDDVITRLYQEVPEERYDAIDEEFMLYFLSDFLKTKKR